LDSRDCEFVDITASFAGRAGSEKRGNNLEENAVPYQPESSAEEKKFVYYEL
jgi:hypothetical protein